MEIAHRTLGLRMCRIKCVRMLVDAMSQRFSSRVVLLESLRGRTVNQSRFRRCLALHEGGAFLRDMRRGSAFRVVVPLMLEYLARLLMRCRQIRLVRVR